MRGADAILVQAAFSSGAMKMEKDRARFTAKVNRAPIKEK